jgi:CheY-like chemotaxis protein
VESTLGEGSEFRVEIPVGRDVPAAALPELVLSGCSVVILSENAPESEAIARTIAAYGGQAEVAGSVEDAARQILARPKGCDAVLIDAAIERCNGRLLKRLRRAVPNSFQAVILIAPSDRGQLVQYRASGYSTFLARPVRSETLLRVLLARQTAELEATSASPRSATGSKPLRARPAGLSVLLAEDNEINAMLARATLAKAGHDVQVVGNGRAAVEAVTRPAGKRFDLVLMDLHMPVMDGLDAIALIRKNEEEKGLAPVPIMVLSADSQEGTRHAVLAHGATGFVGKPLDPQALIEAIAEHAVA